MGPMPEVQPLGVGITRLVARGTPGAEERRARDEERLLVRPDLQHRGVRRDHLLVAPCVVQVVCECLCVIRYSLVGLKREEREERETYRCKSRKAIYWDRCRGCSGLLRVRLGALEREETQH